MVNHGDGWIGGPLRRKGSRVSMERLQSQQLFMVAVDADQHARDQQASGRMDDGGGRFAGAPTVHDELRWHHCTR